MTSVGGTQRWSRILTAFSENPEPRQQDRFRGSTADRMACLGHLCLYARPLVLWTPGQVGRHSRSFLCRATQRLFLGELTQSGIYISTCLAT